MCHECRDHKRDSGGAEQCLAVDGGNCWYLDSDSLQAAAHDRADDAYDSEHDQRFEHELSLLCDGQPRQARGASYTSARHRPFSYTTLRARVMLS